MVVVARLINIKTWMTPGCLTALTAGTLSHILKSAIIVKATTYRLSAKDPVTWEQREFTQRTFVFADVVSW